MKRLLRSLLLGAILSALLCVGALAAESEPDQRRHLQYQRQCDADAERRKR